MKKLVAIDLDGTLLNDDLRLPSLSKEVLLKLNEEGFLIILATGRPFRALSSFYNAVKLTHPVICYNGALAFDPLDASFVPLKKKFAVSDIVSIFSLVKDKTTSFMCETHKKIYSTVFDSYLDHYFPYNSMDFLKGDIDMTLHEDVYTAIMRSEKKDDEMIEKTVTSHPNILYRHWTESPYSECFLKGVDKGVALQYIMDHYGIKKEDVYAFGDSNNDFEMLSLSGHPFAMKGSKSSRLKTSFPLTEEGNNDEGVAKTLQSLFIK